MSGTEAAPASATNTDRDLGTRLTRRRIPWAQPATVRVDLARTSSCSRSSARHAFNPSAAPADALIDIRDAIRQYDGEFADQE